jgi:hypothetical protein
MTNDTRTNWALIDLIAQRLGVKTEARRKWRQRNSVPHKWRLALILASGGALSANDFLNNQGDGNALDAA